MSDIIALGAQPQTLRVLLTTGQDFYADLELNAAWPVGTTLSIVLPTTTWTATIGGVNAVFNVDKALADVIAHGETAKLVYANGTTDQVWGVGTVVRTDG